MASQEYYYNLITKENEKQKKKDIADINAQVDTNKQIISDSYKTKIADTNASYDELNKKNEAQRLLNQRFIERKAAEMGLTDSGFNRTQLTASQLAYSNQQGNIMRDQQKAVDTLATAMRSQLAELDMKRNTSLNDLDRSYNQYAIEQAEKLYNDDVSAQAKITAANISAQSKRESAYRDLVSDLEEKMLDEDLSPAQKSAMLDRADLEPEDLSYLIELGGDELKDYIGVGQKLDFGRIAMNAANRELGFSTYGY
jgi:hypothetical protein